MIYYFFIDLFIFLPELFFSTCGLLVFIWALCFIHKEIKLNQKLIKNLIYLFLEIQLITILLLINNLNKEKIIFYESLNSNNYSIISKLFILSCTILFIFLTKNQIVKQFSTHFEFISLLLFITFALLILVSANDFITLYLSIEMQSLSLYILVSFKKKLQFSAEAGLKYFILGAFSSSLLLFGISLLYGATGSTNFNDIIKINNSSVEFSYIFILGFVLLITGLLFKLTAFPFHIWSPDVYEGAPFIVMIFLSTIPKWAIFSIFVKIVYSIFFTFYSIWQPLLFYTAIVTIIFSSIITLYQKKIKRFFAYSSINHVGYMLIGLSTGTLLGVQALFLYLITYLITTFLFFGVLMSIQKNKGKNLVYLTDLLVIKEKSVFSQTSLTLILFSLAGIPPLMGFFSKCYILLSIIEVNYYLPGTVVILCSTVSAFYYIRVIKVLNFEKYYKPILVEINQSIIAYLYLISSFLLILFFIIIPNWLFIETYFLVLLI